MNKDKSTLYPEQLSEEDGLYLLFVDIFKSYEAPLYQLALRMVKDSTMSQDLVQEVFLKLWALRSKLHEIEHIEGFLYRLMQNKIIDFMRKVAADKRLKEELWHTMKNSDVVNNETEYKDYQAIIAQAIRLLPPQRRKAYLMRDEGLNYEQIAEQLEISKHTVKNQLSAAVRFIRSYVTKKTE